MSKKITLKLELPSEAEIVAGLDEHTCYPKLAKVEAAVAKAESDLAAAREKLAALESNAARMPERIRLGEEPVAALASLLRSRDAAALCIPAFESGLEKARAALKVAKAAAAEAVKKELAVRTALLVEAAAKVAPLCELLTDLDHALGRAESPDNFCTGADVTWPCSNQDELAFRRR